MAQAELAAKEIDNVRPRLNEVLFKEQESKKDIHIRSGNIAKSRESLANLRVLVDANQAVLEQLRSGTPPNLWDRLMNFLGRESQRMADLRRSLEAPTQALADASACFAEAAKQVAMAQAQLAQQQSLYKAVIANREALERELNDHKNTLQAGYAKGAIHFTDEQFWDLPRDTRYRASVAVGPKLDDLRANLFLHALELHRLSILANAGKFIANLRAVNAMLTGNMRGKLSPVQCSMLWDAFFFVVPVVSTTLASFDRLFSGMGQNSLGWLLIDEAGQATPQSAAGAIWRSRRTVIVGDPLQIEPVFTIPHSLVEDLRVRHNVNVRWSPIDESVQTLADRITPFGSWISQGSTTDVIGESEQIWTGMPLRTHRRCDDPMFSISNDIAYANQMVQGRINDSGLPESWDFSCSLGESSWLDVRSSNVAHPVSEDEIACLLDCLLRLQINRSNKAKVYVISPFRKIAQACGKQISAARINGVECGTVHTFQGKEADIVFLMLGTASGQAGAGARNWAASKPNLLNVAVTRAKCRLFVIGDVSQWGKLPYFHKLSDALPIRRMNAT